MANGAFGRNDDSQRKTEERRGKERENWEKEGDKLLRQLKTGREERGACCILIALAVSTSRLKIRLNERWRDKEKGDIY